MIVAVAVLVLVGAAVLVVVVTRAGRRAREAVLTTAARYEAEGQFEAACYHYGIAAWRGAREVGEARVRALWREHGPFSFADVRQEMQHTYCAQSESCGEGFHQITTQEIVRVVSAEALP